MPKPKNAPKLTYVNCNRTKNGKDKYKKDVEAAILKFAHNIGKESGDQFSDGEWKTFFRTVLIPLDKDTEKHMIDLFMDNRTELNNLFILHNTKASDNIAEAYFKRYEKNSPTKWYDLEDFKQMALEGLAIAAKKFDVNSGNKFITYATWWVLNRVRKPNQERGALEHHVSFNKVLSQDEGDSTLEDVCTPDRIAPDVNYSMLDETIMNPVSRIEQMNSNANCELYNRIKDEDTPPADPRTLNLVKYLMSIVDGNKDSYSDRQILLYVFKKVFSKSSPMFIKTSSESRKLTKYISEAAKSKSELLARLGMDEDEYEDACSRLIGRKYDGV